MNPWLNRFLYSILPGQCILCWAATHREIDLCVECEADLPKIMFPCWSCGLEMLDDREVCEACEVNPPSYRHCFSTFQYAAPIDRLIGKFKNQSRLVIGRALSLVLAKNYASHHLVYPDVWLPVPLHPSKLSERGFNQALEIACVLSEVTKRPVVNNAVIRTSINKEQKALTITEREENVKSAFKVTKSLKNLSVGLVDDIVTTGATAKVLSEALLDAGALEVQVISLARTPK